MKIFRRFVAAAALIFSLTVVSAVEKVSHHAYVGAIVIDAASGQTLFEDNADEQNPPASMTKLMTYAVLSDKLASGSITLQTPVRITIEDAKMGGTQVYLDPRETEALVRFAFCRPPDLLQEAGLRLAQPSKAKVACR